MTDTLPAASRLLAWFPYDAPELERRLAGASLLEEGILHRAWRRAWLAPLRGEAPGTVRDTPDAWAALLGAEWKRHAPTVRQHFTPDPTRPGFLVCPWLAALYAVQLERHRVATENGRRGGRPRKPRNPEDNPPAKPQRNPRVKPQPRQIVEGTAFPVPVGTGESTFPAPDGAGGSPLEAEPPTPGAPAADDPALDVATAALAGTGSLAAAAQAAAAALAGQLDPEPTLVRRTTRVAVPTDPAALEAKRREWRRQLGVAEAEPDPPLVAALVAQGEAATARPADTSAPAPDAPGV